MLLAALNCVCGGSVFLAASIVFPESWLPPMLTVAVSTVITIAFAYWVSNIVLRPLDKLVLLAQSIERTPGMSVPKTTGSVETDDLLHTISRTSRQLSNFLDLMDEVAAGNTKVAIDPLEYSDRLSESFQKLVGRVTDSIDAKIELDELRDSVGGITKELENLRRGESVHFRNELESTKVISHALRQLIEWKQKAKLVIGSNASDLKTVISDGKGRLDSVIEKNVAVERCIADVTAAIGGSAADADSFFREISTVITNMEPDLKAGASLHPSPVEKARLQQSVHKQVDSAIHRLRDVGEQVNSIRSVTRAFDELAKRSNQTALAAFVAPLGTDISPADELMDEIASLSENAANANTVISELGDAVVRDMVEVNASIQWVIGEYDKLADRMFTAETRLGELSINSDTLFSLRKQIDKAIDGSAAKTTQLLEVLKTGVKGTRRSTEDVRRCEATFEMMNEALESMRELSAEPKNVITLTGIPGPYSIAKNGNGQFDGTASAGEA